MKWTKLMIPGLQKFLKLFLVVLDSWCDVAMHLIVEGYLERNSAVVDPTSQKWEEIKGSSKK